MSAGPIQTLRVAAGAARRAFVRDLFFAAGRGLGAGCGVALLLVGAGKLGVTMPAWPVLLGYAAGAGLIGAGLWAILRRWSVMRGAEELDGRLGLKNRLSTAVALARSKGRAGDPFTGWAIADAERAALTVKLDRAVPLQLDWTWGLWPVLAAGVIGIAMFVPARPPRSPNLRPEPTAADRVQAAAQVRQTADAIKQGLADQRVQGATQEQLKALAELERELAQGGVDPEQGAVQAAKQVEDLAQRLEADAAAAEKQADAVREQLAKAASQKDAQSGEQGSPLMEAIERGDITAAAEEIAKAAQDEPTLTSAEREQLARDMEQLAQAIEADRQEAERPPPESKPAEDQTPAAPKPPAAGSPNPEPPPNEGQAPRPPEPQSPNQETAPEQPKSAESPKPDQPPKSEPQTDEREKLREALRDAARELREEPKQSESNGEKPREQDQGGAGERQPSPPQSNKPKDGSKPRDESRGEPGATGQPKPDKQGTRQGDQTGDKTGHANKQQPDKGQPGSTGQQSGQEPKGQTPKGEPGDQESNDPGPKPGEQPTPQPGGQEPPDRQQPGGDPQRQPTGQPNPRPDASSGPTGATGASGPSSGEGNGPESPTGEGAASADGPPRGDAPETDGKSPSGLERAAKELKRLSDGSGQGDKERARQLREMARKMLEESTPEQREQYRRLAEDFAREHGDGGPGTGPAPFTTRPPPPLRDGPVSPIDARRPATVSGNEKPPERTVAQWYSAKPAEPGERAAAPTDVFKQAAQGAERAIENQQVPGRYQDLLRRVFRRYSEQAPPK